MIQGDTSLSVGGMNWDIRIPRGDMGIDATVAIMRAIVHSTDRSPLFDEDRVWGLMRAKMLRHSVRLPGAFRQITKMELSRYVYGFLELFVRFKPDPISTEFLQHPDITLLQIVHNNLALGDCDDRAMLGASIFRALGLPGCIAVIGTQDGKPYQHVFWGYLKNTEAAPTVENCVFSDPQEHVPHGTYHPESQRLKIYTV